MKLQKRVQNLNKLVEQKQAVQQKAQSNVKNSEICWNAELNAGKYAARTLEWVRLNDSSYLIWMHSKDLFRTWGLLVSDQQKKVSTYATDEGVRYLYLSFIPVENGTPSKWL